MLSSARINAPAGLDGWGSCVMPPSLLAAAPAFQGTGLPVAGMPQRLRDGAARREVLVVDLVLGTTNVHPITTNDRTTLGNHTPGRPRS